MSYDHPTKNPNFFFFMLLFFSVQLGHLKLSGYGMLSTQAVQNRSRNCWAVSQSYVMPISLPGGGAKKVGGPEGVNPLNPAHFGGPTPAHVLAESSIRRARPKPGVGSIDAPSPCGDFDIGGSYPCSSSHGGSTPKACF